MRAVVQRVHEASVAIDTTMTARIDKGLLVYLGVVSGDDEREARFIADKIRHLRIFPDDLKPMNRDVVDVGGSILVVSAFTIAGDARRGRRPSFDDAARPEEAKPLYERVCDILAEQGLPVARGKFGASMDVRSNNDGPVCILLDSTRVF